MRISDWSSDVCSSDLSTLQQEAARKLGFSASHTMRIAQGLYEDGAITYMRTDGVQMDGSAISAARVAVANLYEASYVPRSGERRVGKECVRKSRSWWSASH